jgi:SHS family sialic acid transporter-like MFS transporter
MTQTGQEVSKKAMAATLAAAFLGWMFDGMEIGLFPLVARPALKELLGPSADISTWFSIVMAGFLVGAAAGGVIFGWLGDRIGRVKAMFWSIVVYAVFTGLGGLATASWQLAILRFMASLGMGGEWALGVALIMEVWPVKWRPMLAGLIGAASNIGFLLIALVGLALTQLLDYTGWRLLFFVAAGPALLAFLVILYVPESKRWQQAASSGPKNKVSDIFKGNIRRYAILGTLISTIILLGTWGSVQFIPAWADRLTEGKMPTAKAFAQIASALGAIVAAFLAPMVAHWTNRRNTYFLLCLTSLLACQYLFRWSGLGYGNLFLVWVFIVGGLTASFYGFLPLYLPELFPTRIRATAQGFAYNAGRILAAMGVLGSGQILKLFREDYAQMCAVISLIYVAGLVLIWFCPETKGRPLPE